MARLPVSKTGRGGSNPSAPAKKLRGRGGLGSDCPRSEASAEGQVRNVRDDRLKYG